MLWFVACSSPLHKIVEDSNSHNQKIEWADNNQPRRYLDYRINSRGSVVFKGHSNFPVKQFRFPIKLKEICSGSFPELEFLGVEVDALQTIVSRRLGVSLGGQERMEIEPFSISCYLQKERISRSRSICISSVSSSEGLFFLENGPIL